jgi:hypothetical protein
MDASSRADTGIDASPAIDASSRRESGADASDASHCEPGASAFYLATDGADTNPCTVSEPCLTFEQGQKMMAASSTIKTTYVRAGTYARTTEYTFNDGEMWLGYPCDPPHSATIDATALTAGGAAFHCDGCSNVAMWNFTFSGAPTFNGGAWSDSDILIEAGNGVYVDNNVFTGNLAAYNESDIYSFNGNDIYIRGNVFQGTASGEPISTPYTQAGTYSGLYITDNSFSGCQRWCVETQIQVTTSFAVSDLHIDRNTFTAFQGPNGQCGDGDHYTGAISAAGPASTSAQWATKSTIWGNTFTAPSTNNNCIWGIEVGWTGTSVEYNTLSYVGAAMAIAGMPGTEVENNTMILLTSGSHSPNCGGGGCAFIPDGGYNGTEWVGVNTINGTAVTGCVAPFCALGHGPYGTRPSVTTPSTAYTGDAP